MMQYLDGELEEAERQGVDAHLAECELCRKEWQSFQQLKGATDMVTMAKPPDMVWDQWVHHFYNRLERGLGWIMLSIGAAMTGFFGVYHLFKEILFGNLNIVDQSQVNQAQPSLLAPKRPAKGFDGYMAEELDKIPWINRGGDSKGWVAGSGPYKGKTRGDVTSMIRNTWRGSPEIRSEWDNVVGGGLDTEQDRRRESTYKREANAALAGQSYRPGSTAGSGTGIPSPGNSWGAGTAQGYQTSQAPGTAPRAAPPSPPQAGSTRR